MIKKINNPPETSKWIVAGLFTLSYAVLVSLYLTQLTSFRLEESNFWLSFLAATAGFMLATSFSASSFSYFFGWSKMRDVYQKQIGVTVFWLCFIYCVGLLIVEPEIYFYGFWDNIATPNFILGLSAMTIFGLMIGINSGPIALYVSWDTIRLFLILAFRLLFSSNAGCIFKMAIVVRMDNYILRFTYKSIYFVNISYHSTDYTSSYNHS